METNKFSNLLKVVGESNCSELKKVHITIKDNVFLKFIRIIPICYYRRYYLNLVFKNQSIKRLSLRSEIKDKIKYEVSRFNIFLLSS